ncbi:hypothetical protein [Streptomyces sp. ODS05-4]|uniref:hypothetical protein n=1 Tax=Streptomyces sp. ODS05-4 TaxID=2944939 RepID=UPI00210ACB11|nr:hypothetical protein [Streptomyces sp. ODS05-4]
MTRRRAFPAAVTGILVAVCGFTAQAGVAYAGDSGSGAQRVVSGAVTDDSGWQRTAKIATVQDSGWQ